MTATLRSEFVSLWMNYITGTHSGDVLHPSAAASIGSEAETSATTVLCVRSSNNSQYRSDTRRCTALYMCVLYAVYAHIL